MSILVEIIQGLGSIVLGIINVYIWVIIISALLSFVNPDPFNPIVQFLYRITNPAYMFVRRFVRTNFNGLDLAPLIIVIGLQVILVVLSALLRAL
ncbi:MAG: YggT family protein [Sulfurimonas sp.]|uniref:YggT family protein n=1 Tax=Sulfurimonas sp. TaxID=2022749 RepID=UPI002629F49E|nr:YggT family protein [Sulfurimonas sp.]MDD2652596.1 YggT family protein [Sulfurimonas sp.]MDD3450738.1 YggT family protein [Sulfurimonas sp.]